MKLREKKDTSEKVLMLVRVKLKKRQIKQKQLKELRLSQEIYEHLHALLRTNL